MMFTIPAFQHLSASKLQSLNSKPRVLSANPGCFTVCYVDALSLSAGSLHPNGTEKKHLHTQVKNEKNVAKMPCKYN